MFQKYDYPAYEQHKSIHEKLIGEVEKNVDNFKCKDESTRENLMIFLTDWLKDHILGDDKKFGQFLKIQGEVEDEDL